MTGEIDQRLLAVLTGNDLQSEENLKVIDLTGNQGTLFPLPPASEKPPRKARKPRAKVGVVQVDIEPPNEAEKAILDILRLVPGYPVDEKIDLPLIRFLSTEYPSLDSHWVVKEWRAYKMTAPIQPGERPRSQLRMSFMRQEEWQRKRKEREAAETIDLTKPSAPSDGSSPGSGTNSLGKVNGIPIDHIDRNGQKYMTEEHIDQLHALPLYRRQFSQDGLERIKAKSYDPGLNLYRI